MLRTIEKDIEKQNGAAKGFTIIEVLIVLAIAGLILLIVFLAVPSLQRNARNTSRKNDVSSLLGGMAEYTNNQNGTFPASCAAGAGGCAGQQWLQNSKLGALDPNLVAFTRNTSAVAPAAPASTTTNATRRSFVALYRVETGNGTQTQCVESGS